MVAPLRRFAVTIGCVLVEILSALAVLILVARLLGIVRSFEVRIRIDPRAAKRDGEGTSRRPAQSGIDARADTHSGHHRPIRGRPDWDAHSTFGWSRRRVAAPVATPLGLGARIIPDRARITTPLPRGARREPE